LSVTGVPSLVQGGRSVHKGGVAGFQSGEGPSAGATTRHRVVIHNHHANQTVEVEVPEDR
jgi:ferredoxin